MSFTRRRLPNANANVQANVASTAFCSRWLYQSRMNRGDREDVACCTTRTPMVTTRPSRPTIAPTIVVSRVVAVFCVYCHCTGTVTDSSISADT